MNVYSLEGEKFALPEIALTELTNLKKYQHGDHYIFDFSPEFIKVVLDFVEGREKLPTSEEEIIELLNIANQLGFVKLHNCLLELLIPFIKKIKVTEDDLTRDVAEHEAEYASSASDISDEEDFLN